MKAIAMAIFACGLIGCMADDPASTARTEQALTGFPSRSKVQAPQTWTSQDTLVPFKFNWLRSTSASVSAGSHSTDQGLPFRVNCRFNVFS